MSIVLTQINIYPVKSLGGIKLNSAELTERGIKHDRRWMLIDDNNKFLTIRQHPEFLFYELSLTDNGFEIKHKDGNNKLVIPLSIDKGDIIKVRIWDDEVTAIVADDNTNGWFLNQLGFSCRLVYLPDSSPRRVQREWVNGERHVSFADAYPYLIAGEQSVADLNDKIEEEITLERFRPNLVFSGGEPYEEFLWKEIKINEVRMQCIKPCTRCIVTTMHPETAVMGKEPLKTLFKQRIDNKMVFGENAIMLEQGTISIGDEIEIISTKNSPYEKV